MSITPLSINYETETAVLGGLSPWDRRRPVCNHPLQPRILKTKTKN